MRYVSVDIVRAKTKIEGESEWVLKNYLNVQM